jgi:hypothetical protein
MREGWDNNHPLKVAIKVEKDVNQKIVIVLLQKVIHLIGDKKK